MIDAHYAFVRSESLKVLGQVAFSGNMADRCTFFIQNLLCISMVSVYF